MKKKIRAKYHHYQFIEMKGRDNKDYYNTCDRSMAMSRGQYIRVPSLKRNRSVWDHFYKLFPFIKESLIKLEYVRDFGYPTLINGIYICKDERIHNGAGYRIRTTKFLKVW